MSALGKLTILLSIENRTTFIDGIRLNNDVRRTFIQETSFDCYVDYNSRERGQFIHVRILCVIDTMRPFEHEFFERIRRSFLSLKRLTVCNQLEQKRSWHCLDHEQANGSLNILISPSFIFTMLTLTTLNNF